MLLVEVRPSAADVNMCLAMLMCFVAGSKPAPQTAFQKGRAQKGEAARKEP